MPDFGAVWLAMAGFFVGRNFDEGPNPTGSRAVIEAGLVG
jgi:hypothetical protein